jgi:hypothetical protein
VIAAKTQCRGRVDYSREPHGINGARQGVGAAVQQPPVAAVDVEKLGPQLGEAVPDFSLPDQHGVRRRVCFIPQSVPLSWTMTLRPLDRERVKAQ